MIHLVRAMVRTFLLLCLVVQLSFRGIVGDYEVLITVHSFALLDSRCGECYGEAGEPIQRDSCCDGDNMTSCPESCDILLRFCRLSDLQFTRPADRLPQGTRCATVLESRAEDLLGNDFKSGETCQFNETGSLGGMFASLSNPVKYYGVGNWKGAQLNVPVVDQDFDDFDDLIDYFSIPLNISAGSSMTSNFTGRYNYVQLELTIEVRCIGVANNMDESCVCLPGFTGLLCEDNCTGIMCKSGGRCVDGSCYCGPGFTGAMCELEVTTSTSVSASEMATSTSAPPKIDATSVVPMEMATTSSAPAASVAAITGGVVGGVLFSITLVILILILALLVFRQRRTKSFDIQRGSATNTYDSSKVVLQSGDVHIYDVAAKNGAHKTGTSGSEILKEFNNPIYGDDPELEHKYETTDKAHSSSKDHSDQYQGLEWKFENPIYGDEDDGNLNNPIPVHESNIDYDQVGNVYHTLECQEDRQQRYAEAGQAAGVVAASVEIKGSSKGQTGKPQHSYEDVQ